MTTVDVDGLRFDIPDRFHVGRYDDWAFYRNKVARIAGAKAIDLGVAAKDDSVAYLVEVKDYRTDPATGQRRTRTKPIDLADEIASKVLHSLGGLAAARLHGGDEHERAVSTAACRTLKLRAVLHLEQSSGRGAFSQVVNPANVQIKLRSVLKSVDPHAVVVSRSTSGGLPWTVA